MSISTTAASCNVYHAFTCGLFSRQLVTSCMPNPTVLTTGLALKGGGFRPTTTLSQLPPAFQGMVTSLRHTICGCKHTSATTLSEPTRINIVRSRINFLSATRFSRQKAVTVIQCRKEVNYTGPKFFTVVDKHEPLCQNKHLTYVSYRVLSWSVGSNKFGRITPSTRISAFSFVRRWPCMGGDCAQK